MHGDAFQKPMVSLDGGLAGPVLGCVVDAGVTTRAGLSEFEFVADALELADATAFAASDVATVAIAAGGAEAA